MSIEMVLKKAAIVVAMTILLCAGQAQAADKIDLARQYYGMIDFSETMKASFSDKAIAQIAVSIKKRASKIKLSEAEITEELKELRERLIQPDYLNKIKELLIKITVEVFSKDELKALVKFYSSKEGKSIINKMPILTQRCNLIISEMTMDQIRDVIRALMEKHKKNSQK